MTEISQKYRITAIKPQKAKDRVNIYLDGKFGFGIDYENYVKYKLKVESELTSEQIEKIKGEADFQKVLNKIIDFASRRPRSEYEYKLWLRRKKIPEDLHNRLFDSLKDFDLLDDEEFARWWVDQRLTFQKKSKRVMTQELRLKGVDKEIIQKVLSEQDIDEVNIAKDLLASKKYKWESLEESERKKKMTEFLARRGFSWDVVHDALD